MTSTAQSGVSDALWRAHLRAAHSPNRIVVGQIGVSHAQADRLRAAGLWEIASVETCKGKPCRRYRITNAARATLSQEQKP